MSTHNHPIAAEELMAYLDGELGPAEATAAGTHLEDCLECQQLVADLRNVSQAVKSWKVFTPGSSAMPQAIVAALNAQSAERVPVPAIPMPWPIRLRNVFGRRMPLAAAGVFATLVIAAVMMSNLLRVRHSDHYAQSRVLLDNESPAPSAAPPSAGPASGRSTTVTLASPGIAADSNGLFHGIGDHPANSSSVDGQPITDQQSRVFQSLPVPGSAGKTFDRLQTFSKLNSGPTGRSQAPESTGPMIIRTAGLSLITKEFDKARAQVEEITRRRRGYVGTLTVTGASGSGRTLTGSLRIPATQLDATLAELKTLGRLNSESQNGEDITSQYVDLNARLANARHTEQSLTDLLQNHTGQLSEVLQVENELARVRGEIESMEAERKTMANQADFATINLTITEDYRAQLQVVPPSTSTRLSNAAVEGYRNLTDGLMSVALFFLESGPSLLLWVAILFFPARFAWRKLRHSFSGATV